MSYKAMSIAPNLKFVLFLGLLLVGCVCGEDGLGVCDEFPGEDFVVLVWNSSQSVVESELLGEGDLPSGWGLVSQTFVEWPEYKKIIAEDPNEIRRIQYYGKDGSDFRRLVVQKFVDERGDDIYLQIEEFNSHSTPKFILEDVAADYTNTFINVWETKVVPGVWDKAFYAQLSSGLYTFMFFEDDRLFELWGDDLDELLTLSEKYVRSGKSLSVEEEFQYKAVICKDHAEVCNTVVPYSSVFETVDLRYCGTNTTDSYIECPQKRADKHANAYVLQFPVCERGNIISYGYEKNTVYPISNSFWSNTNYIINKTHPVKHLHITVETPALKSINYDSRIQPEIVEGNQTKTYVWDVKDIRPYKAEEYMPEKEYVLDTISYSSIPLWSTIEEWFEERFRVYVEPTEELTELADNITGETGSDREKAEKLFQWVRDNIRYESHELGLNTGYEPNWPENTLEYRFGDCKDQATLLAALAKAVNVTAYPAVLARDGYEKTQPNLYVFPHAVTAFKLDGETVFADPTCSHCPFGYLTSDYQQASAFILSDGRRGFTQTPASPVDVDNHQTVNYTLHVSGGGKDLLELTLKTTGSPSINLRYWMDEDRDELNSMLLENVPETCVQVNDSFEVVDEGDPLSLTLTKTYECTNLVKDIGDDLSLTFFGKFFYNDLIQPEKRNFPIKLDKTAHLSYNTEVILPEEYDGDVPERKTEDNPYLKYDIGYSVGDGVFSQNVEYTVEGGTIPTVKYAEFRDSMKQLQTSMLETVVFKKQEKSQETKPVQEDRMRETTTTTVKPQQPVQTDNTLLYAVIGVLLLVVAALSFMVFRKGGGP